VYLYFSIYNNFNEKNSFIKEVVRSSDVCITDYVAHPPTDTKAYNTGISPRLCGFMDFTFLYFSPTWRLFWGWEGGFCPAGCPSDYSVASDIFVEGASQARCPAHRLCQRVRTEPADSL